MTDHVNRAHALLSASGAERWCPIRSWEGLYEISDTGIVKSLPRKVSYAGKTGNTVSYVTSVSILVSRSDKDGYRLVDLRSGDVRETHKVHRLVAEAFIPNPLEKPEVNHGDGDKANNKVSNLEWVTDSENKLHRFAKLQSSRGASKQYGVRKYHRNPNKWLAYSTYPSNYTHIGIFQTFNEAVVAAKKWRDRYAR